jgi:hypothetical protein
MIAIAWFMQAHMVSEACVCLRVANRRHEMVGRGTGVWGGRGRSVLVQ